MIQKLLILFFINLFLAFAPLYTKYGENSAFLQSVYAAQDIKINSINFDNSDSIIFLGTSTVEDSAEIKITKKQLTEPDRIFFDIENAIITFPNAVYNIKNSRLQQVRIAQNSTEPNIVRIVIYKSHDYNSSEIKVLKFKNNIIIKLSNEIPLQPYLTQIYRETSKSAIDYYDKTVVIPEEKTESDEIFQKVQQAFKEDDNELVRPNIEQKQARLKSRFFLEKAVIQNGNLLISGIGVINVKKPIILSDPSRVVYDLPNTIVLQELRNKEFKLAENTTFKIGQFEPSTARIVITTSTPNIYIPIYSSDLQSITIANKNNTSLVKYTTPLAKLTYFKEQNINTETDVINIIFTNPIVYSLKRENNGINAIIYNLTEFDTNSFNKVAQENKTGFIAKQLSSNTYQIFFPASSNILVDCYETLNAQQLRFVFTKQKQMEKPLLVEPPRESTTIRKPVIPESKLNSEDLSDNIKNKKPVIKKDKKRSKAETDRIKKIKNKTIIIDPGHGGNDTGAMRYGVLEKNLTLDIALKVRDILKEKGFKKIIMTRSVDKTLTLQDRVDIANSNNADIYVSIHINASVKSEINGIETHYYSQNGYNVAKVMHKELISKIDALDRGLFKSKFYVINHTEAPAVLLELGFISNDKERNSMQSEKRQTDSAQAIAEGIINYLTEY